MTEENNELTQIKKVIDKCLDKLYLNDENLFKHNLCERCIVFRFAHYLQEEFSDYFIDCDYNSSIINGERRDGKRILNKRKFIDIIVHERKNYNSDFICFEIKKWNNCTKKSVEKDQENLIILTDEYGYKFGFHIVFGKIKDETKIMIFENGNLLKNS
jgi:hypothetical protein